MTALPPDAAATEPAGPDHADHSDHADHADHSVRSLRDGLRAGLPFAVAGGLFALTFGVAGRPLIGALPALVMSAIVFAGASQFAALAVLAAGGGVVTAIVVGTLVNLRFLPMGVSIAPSLEHRVLGRVARAQAIVDPSWVMARRPDGLYDIDFMLGATLAQYISWVGGTALGVALGPLLGDTKAFGLDAVFPAFMLGLLATELRRPVARLVAAVGALIAICLTPVLPAGLPIVAAIAATALGLGWQT